MESKYSYLVVKKQILVEQVLILAYADLVEEQQELKPAEFVPFSQVFSASPTIR